MVVNLGVGNEEKSQYEDPAMDCAVVVRVSDDGAAVSSAFVIAGRIEIDKTARGAP
jgi:hypothetical protein